MKAVQTSKSCNIICMYTAFTATDSSPGKGLLDAGDVKSPGNGGPAASLQPSAHRSTTVTAKLIGLHVCGVCMCLCVCVCVFRGALGDQASFSVGQSQRAGLLRGAGPESLQSRRRGDRKSTRLNSSHL